MAEDISNTDVKKADDPTKRNEGIGELNSPEIDEKTGKPTKKAVSSFGQAYSLSKRLYDKAKDGRLKTNGLIAGKYAGDPPFYMSDLRKTGQTWRNNYSTGYLPSVVDRAKPQLTDPIKQTESLTFSTLRPEIPQSSEKTRKFRTRTTKLIRSWPGWVDHVDQVAQECYLYGGAVPGWLDDDWRPKAFKNDESFVPEGTGQHATQAQFVMFLQPVLLHDFLKKIEDKEIAEDAKYNLEGCYKAANEAGGYYASGEESPTKAVDAKREQGTLGQTYGDGEAKVIWLYHLVVREYEGGVALWTTTQKNGHGIRHVENIQDTMPDALTLFTLETGNEKFYGSKGMGRKLTNIHIAIERARNLASDAIYLSGLPILQAPGKSMNSVAPRVIHPFIIVDDSVKVTDAKIEFDVQGYELMDNKLSQIGEGIAGAFIPPKLTEGATPTTKIEAAEKAAREMAIRNGVLGRFFGHFADHVGTIQRKIYSPDNLKEAKRIYEEALEREARGIRMLPKRIFSWMKSLISKDSKVEAIETSKIADAEAVECIVDLLRDGLLLEEIVELALSPAGSTVADQGEQKDQETIQYLEGRRGDPNFNQKNLAKMQSELAIGADRTQQVVNEFKEDPNEEAHATRWQIMEFSEMIGGNQMPVVITDYHRIHRKVLAEKMIPILQLLQTAPTPEMAETAQLATNHYGEHVAKDQHINEEEKKAEFAALEDWQKVIDNADKMLQELAEQAAAAQAEGGVNGMPPPLPGAPLQATGPNGALAGTNGDAERTALEADKNKADVILRAGDQAIAHRKLDIEEKKLAHQDETHQIDMATQVMQDVAQQAADAQKQGMQDAQSELEAQQQRPEV